MLNKGLSVKVIEHIKRASKPLISFEIIPPKRGGDIKGLLSIVEDISKYNPPFIDITSHAAEVIYEETQKGIQRRVKRKRPGTLGVCALIQYKYDIDSVPHVLCQGFTREETEDFLIELQYLGIQNILAVRGDESNYQKPLHSGRSMNIYAKDLVKQIADMNKGKYLEENLLDAKASDFCIGVGGYPEKHIEAPNIDSDIKYTKQKVDAGADYIVTQMFYDNNVFFEYEKKCRGAGIGVPIIPGLKILTDKNNLKSLPKNFFVNIPVELSEEINKAKPEHILEIGVNWAAKQVEELFNNNVPAVHFYIMQNSKPILCLLNKINF
jgi:methylenetetrahydrofolate reductase (NADPH)